MKRSTESWRSLGLVLVVALVGCAPKNMKERMARAERQSDEVTSLLEQAERQLRSLEPEKAEVTLQEASEALGHPDMGLSPENELLRTRLGELRAAVPLARQERARRELRAQVDKQRDEVVRELEAVNTAVEDLGKADPGRGDVSAVRDSVSRVQAVLEKGRALEEKDTDYADYVRIKERRLNQALAQAAAMQRVLDFREGPVAAWQEGVGKENTAKVLRGEEQVTAYTEALASFQKCRDAAEKLLTEGPELERLSVDVDGKPTTAKALSSRCRSKADSLGRKVAALAKKAARKRK